MRIIGLTLLLGTGIYLLVVGVVDNYWPFTLLGGFAIGLWHGLIAPGDSDEL